MRIATDTATSFNVASFAEELVAEMSTIMPPVHRSLVPIGKVLVRSLAVKPASFTNRIRMYGAVSSPLQRRPCRIAIAAKVTHDKPENF